MIKKCLLFSVLALVAACSQPKADLVGSWVQPIPGQEESVQGIQIDEGGAASSINMATLVYTGWVMDGKTLTLTGESIGNGQTIAFEETYEIKSLTPDKLVLAQDGVEFEYMKTN